MKRQRKTAPAGKAFPIVHAMETLRRAVRNWPTPVVTVFSENRASPFEILVSTILSLRTQDRTTADASARLFARARTPEAMLRLRRETIERLIYPVGFYKTKAATLRDISRVLLDRHGGRVPDTVEDLLALKGVGRKTANLVVTLGYGKPGICVDTHVHRICNRWGYIETKTPDETEGVLRDRLPKKYWIPINDWLVAFGQNLCKPVSPLCSTCPLRDVCPRIGVGVSR
jgi:endonuclease III